MKVKVITGLVLALFLASMLIVDSYSDNPNQRLITSTLGYDLAWSPIGDKIAFSGHGGDIFLINVDGTNEHKLISTNSTYPKPSWSPNGNRIVFGDVYEAGLSENYTIWVVNIDGSNLTKIREGYSLFPALSSDETKIVYMDNGLGTTGLWVMNSNGTNPTQILPWRDPVFGDSIAVWFSHQDWSPNDEKLVFNGEEFNMSDSSGVGIGRSIWIVNSDGSNATKLVPTSWLYPEKPEWSPDGTKIAYSYPAQTIDNVTKSGVWIMNADGSNKILLVSDARFPTWSPDGTKIAYTTKEGINILDLKVPVGGTIVPINKLKLLIPQIGVISLILVSITVVIKKRRLNI